MKELYFHQSRCDCARARDLTRLQLKAGGQDFVAQRLHSAQCFRRQDYEREVAREADVPPPPREAPPAPYALGVEREMLRATDGGLYAVPRNTVAHPKCSKTGEPAAPVAFSLEETNQTCYIGDRHHDPCDHQPRVFVAIDRTVNATDTPTPATHVPPPVSTCAPTCDTGGPCLFPPDHDRKPSPSLCSPTCRTNTPSVFPTRVPAQESAPANLPPCNVSCPRSSRSTGRRISDCGWCKDPPSFKDAPPRCRPVTIVERLRMRSSRSAPRSPGSSGRRHIHTSVAKCASVPVGGFQEMLRSREQLSEAGLGRIVSLTCTPHAPSKVTPAGKLEINVPPGTCKVRLKVFLDGSDNGACAAPPKMRSRCPLIRTNSCEDLLFKSKESSWLSIKKIQKKFKGCPSPKMSTTDAKCPGSGKPSGGNRPTSFHRTECPPPPFNLRCPPSPPKPSNKPPAKSTSDKPKVCSYKALLLSNIL